MKALLTLLVCLKHFSLLYSQSIMVLGDVIAGRPFTLECKIIRPTADRSALHWDYIYNQTLSIYTSRECTSSIPVSPSSPAGLSGGCQHVNGEEVYTVTIQNVTEDTGRGRWTCHYRGQAANITLDVQVTVSSVSMLDHPDVVSEYLMHNVTCVTSASKPPACIRGYIRRYWHGGGRQFETLRELDPTGDCNEDSSSVQTTTRTLTFTASAEEDGADLYCSASNRVTNPPVESRVYTLNVEYPPVESLRLTGGVNFRNVESGETLSLECRVGKGNPPPTLTWTPGCGWPSPVIGVYGKMLIDITISISPSMNGETCVCNASQIGKLLRWTDQETITFNVLFAPDSVQLSADSGQSGNTVTVTENTTVTFIFATGEANPSVLPTWYINENRINNTELSELIMQRGPNHGYLTTQRYATRVNRYQDGDVIRCEAIILNHGHSEVVLYNLTIDVMYGPDSVQLRADSGQSGNTVTVTENSTVTFTCTSGESKPNAALSWYNSNIRPIFEPQLSEMSAQRGPNGGNLTTQRYVLRVGRHQDGDVIRCETQRPDDEGSKRVSRHLQLNVITIPEITCKSTDVTVFEGQRLKILCDVTSKDDVVIHWSKSGRRIDNAVTTNSQGSARRDITTSTVEFESAETRVSGVYQIEATNSAGSSANEMTIGVIEGQFIPKNLRLLSCTNKEASLVWASGLDDSLVEYYKLEYKGAERLWKRELVKNPGRVKIVMKTLRGLQPGVFYQFRLQPNSDIALSEYATTNCTIQDSQLIRGLRDVPEAGLSKGSMLGVGVLIGAAVVTIIAVFVTYCLRRNTTSSGNTERAADKRDTSVLEERELKGRAVPDMAIPKPSAHGHYEDLDTASSSGPHYEELSRRASFSTPGDHRVYENAPVF